MDKVIRSTERLQGFQAQASISSREDFESLPRKSIYMMMLPGLTIMALFVLSYCSFISISFHNVVAGKMAVSSALTLDNYRRFWGDPLYHHYILDTLSLSAQMTLGSLILAYPLAYCLVRSSSARIRHLILLSLIIPFLSGGITRVYAWMVMLGNAGVVNSSIIALGLTSQPLHFIYCRFGVVTGLIHFLLPFTALSLLGPIRNVPRVLEEGAVNLGASKFQVFIKIVLPLTVPGIVDAVSLTYAIALSSFLFPMLLGGGRVNMMANIIYDSVFVSYDIPFGAALATIFLIISIIVIASFTFLRRSIRRTHV